jgi:hypothetical protein
MACYRRCAGCDGPIEGCRIDPVTDRHYPTKCRRCEKEDERRRVALEERIAALRHEDSARDARGARPAAEATRAP